jgi:hypothetical protein
MWAKEQCLAAVKARSRHPRRLVEQHAAFRSQLPVRRRLADVAGFTKSIDYDVLQGLLDVDAHRMGRARHDDYEVDELSVVRHGYLLASMSVVAVTGY